MVREIIQLGNPALRQPAQRVADVFDVSVQPLINDLIETMNRLGGVGIAAPQINVSQQLFIVASKPNARYPNAPWMQPTAMINPVIEWAGNDIVKDWEGCLSIPGIRALVPRSTHIRVRYMDPASGQELTKEYEDFIARVFQHEYDHLNGQVFLDRVESSYDIVTEAEYKGLMQNTLNPSHISH